MDMLASPLRPRCPACHGSGASQMASPPSARGPGSGHFRLAGPQALDRQHPGRHKMGATSHSAAAIPSLPIPSGCPACCCAVLCCSTVAVPFTFHSSAPRAAAVHTPSPVLHRLRRLHRLLRS
jgi:hypothetical protein